MYGGGQCVVSVLSIVCAMQHQKAAHTINTSLLQYSIGYMYARYWRGRRWRHRKSLIYSVHTRSGKLKLKEQQRGGVFLWRGLAAIPHQLWGLREPGA